MTTAHTAKLAEALIVYDLAGDFGGTWSSNVWKVKYALHYKDIPYETVWVGFHDIAALYEKLKLQPTCVSYDGVTPLPTLPVVVDPKTNSVISDSFQIVQYLDRTYPETPQLIPPGTDILQKTFADMILSTMNTGTGAYRAIIPLIPAKLGNEKSVEYLVKARTAKYKVKSLDELAAARDSSGWADVMKGVESSFSTIDALYRHAPMTQRGIFVMGETISFADLQIVSSLTWIRAVFGEDSKEWKEMTKWHGGRWGALFAVFDKYRN